MCYSDCLCNDSYPDHREEEIKEQTRSIVLDTMWKVDNKHNSPQHAYYIPDYVLRQFIYNWNNLTRSGKIKLNLRKGDNYNDLDGKMHWTLELMDYSKKAIKKRPLLHVYLNTENKYDISMNGNYELLDEATKVITIKKGKIYKYNMGHGSLEDWVENTTLLMIREHVTKYMHKIMVSND